MADDVKEQSEHPYLRLLRERNRLARELARYDEEVVHETKRLLGSEEAREGLRKALLENQKPVPCNSLGDPIRALVLSYTYAMLRHCKILSTRNVLDVLEICAVPIPKERKDMRVRDILRGCTVFAKQSASGSNHRLLWSLRESQE